MMKTTSRLFTLIVLVTTMCALARAQEGDAPGVTRVVVWIDFDADQDTGRFQGAWDQLRDIDVVLVRETSSDKPSVVEAIEILLVHRAFAAVWHDPEGGLQVLFQGSGTPERVSARSGEPAEEGLYLAELMKSRMGDDEVFASLLVTVPGEVVLEGTAQADQGSGMETGAVEIPEDRSFEGMRFGAGYFARAHRDAVTWWQHVVQVDVPTWRIDEWWVVHGLLTIGLPASMGEEGTEWLQIRTMGGDLAIGLVPARGKYLEMELGFGAGIQNYIAVAFLSSGRSARMEHLTGEAMGCAALLWHPSPRVEVRLFVVITHVFAAPSFSIDGRGDFGRNPWQPSIGLDFTMALYRR